MRKQIGIIAALVFVITCVIAISLSIQEPQAWPEVLREKLGPPEYESIDPDKPLAQQTAIFEIAGRTFEMPKVFIQTNLVGKRVLDGINLLYVMPGFTSRVDFRNRAEYEQAESERRFAHMLVEAEAMRPSFNDVIKNLREITIAKEEYVGPVNGLDYYKWYRESPEGPRFDNEIYLEKDGSGNIVSYIECAPKERGTHIRFPGCSHRFRNNGLLYDIYYNKEKFFQAWREHRRRAIEFIDGFEKPREAR